MIPSFLIAQLADLLTFLVAVIAFPELIEHEVGLIGVVYSQFGVVGALTWKCSLALLVAWTFTRTRKTLPGPTVAVATIGIGLGLLGTVMNTIAFWTNTTAR